jgi:hypothetical protein
VKINKTQQIKNENTTTYILFMKKKTGEGNLMIARKCSE